MGEFIRETVYEKLDGSEAGALREEVEDLQRSVETLQLQLARVARAILVVAGSRKEFSAELADQWISKTFGPDTLTEGGDE